MNLHVATYVHILPRVFSVCVCVCVCVYVCVLTKYGGFFIAAIPSAHHQPAPHLLT